MDPPEDAHLREDHLGASDEYGEQPDDGWDVRGLDVPEDDNVFREQLELSPQERAMLEQYSGENRGLRNLDAALRDAVQMVQVSDQRITYLRKMHALLLLRKLKGALQSYDDEEEEEETRRSEVQSRSGRDLLPEDYPEFSSEDDDDQLSRDETIRSARKQKRYMARRGPNSDDFIPVKGGSDFGGHSRGGSLGGKEESVFDPEEALLAKDDDEEGVVHQARPFYTDSGALAPNSFDSDLEKVDADSGSASGTPPEGSIIEKDGDHKATKEKETKEEKAERKAREAAAYDPKRFAKRFQRRRRINWVGSTVFILYIIAFLAYMFIRITKTLQLGSYLVYGLFVLGVEILGATTTFIYGTNLIFTPVNPELDRLKARKGKDAQLPVSDSASVKSMNDGDVSVSGDLEEGGVGKDPELDEVPPVGQYHVRVLIPCYKEPEEIVRQTVAAIRSAVLPPGCHRTVYVCDDGKDKYKRRMCQRLGRDVQYISGRNRPSGETNGKSGNLNNACKQIYPAGCKIPDHEVICVMDADQIADPTFFLKMIPMMDGGDDVGMVLSPQCFHNLNAEADIFNHSNIHFWEYMQPGYDALGFISCTGTNFLIRSKAFQECGWSPEYTLTEDFGLGMELKMRHWQCRYVPEYLAVGEAPDQVRNCFQQRSRWCKGHFQVVFSKQHCPLLQRRLGIFMRILFCSGVWSYIVASIATPTFILVPLLTIWFGIFPIVLSWWAALGLTVYYIATTAVLNYARERKHFMPLWFSNVSTVIMFWTYIKAFFRSVVGKYFGGGIKFKTTLKGLGRLQDSAFGDLIVPVIVLLLCIISLGIGIGKVVNNASGIKTTLLVSLAWMIFNMIPPYLLLHYQFVGRGTTLKIACKLCFWLSFLVGIAALVLIWLLYPKDYNYSEAVNDSVTYFQSTMVGTLPSNSYSVDWRATAYTQDSKSPIVAPLTNVQGAAHDSSGGWMTGGPGGNIKMTQPTAFTTAMLAWGLLEFGKGYGSAKAGVLAQVQVGVDFLQKTLLEYTPNKPNFYVIYQVGNLSTESRYWGYPEANTNTRPSYYVPTNIGTSDLTASMAAAFAASSLVFQDTDKAYAQGLLNDASNLYAAAKAYPGSYSARIRGSVCTTQYERSSIGPTGTILATSGVCKGPYDALNGSALVWYNSTSYYDDMAWAASWMYQATKQNTYLNDAISYYVLHSQGPEQQYDAELLFNWQNTFWGANLKLAQLQGAAAYHQQMQYFMKYWICATGGVPIQFTPLGRAWNENDGSLGTTANAAFLSAVYAQATTSNYAAKSKRYVCFARGQTRYVLGEAGTSYMVGFGKHYSQFPQVMGASCPGAPFTGKAQNCTAAQLISKKGNPHVATGALLEQSTFTDEVSIVRASNNSRTAPEYNAGLIGALAAMDQAPGNWNECLQGNGILSRDKTICDAPT